MDEEVIFFRYNGCCQEFRRLYSCPRLAPLAYFKNSQLLKLLHIIIFSQLMRQPAQHTLVVKGNGL
jgi:hypothetical protein